MNGRSLAIRPKSKRLKSDGSPRVKGRLEETNIPEHSIGGGGSVLIRWLGSSRSRLDRKNNTGRPDRKIISSTKRVIYN